MIERQSIVTWYAPDEKDPPEDKIVVCTVSGKMGQNITYDHAFALAVWYDDGEGFELIDVHLTDLVVHAWCDLEVYGHERLN